MSTMTVELSDPTSTLKPVAAEGAGDLINGLRDDCGFVIQGIDWVCRQFGFDLIAAIFDPIAGDWAAVDAMATNWGALGSGLGQIGGNYSALAGATPSVWTGDAATSATGKLTDFAEAFGTQAEASQLISAAMKDMLVAVKAGVEVIAQLLSLVDELVLKVAASALGWAKEIATGGATARKVISLVNRAITTIKKLEQVIPPLLQACALMSAMMKGLANLLKLGAAGYGLNNGQDVDDVADAGF